MTTGLLTTNLGQAAIAADLGGGTDLVLTHVAWGDAAGVPYTPNPAQTALVNELYRATITSVAVVAGAIVVDAIIPADTADGLGRASHGFNVWEVGLFNNAGTLIGVARMGGGFKAPPASGQAEAATYRIKLAVANPSAITVVIDPQAQVAIGRLSRAGWLTVDGVLNAPPGSPSAGATYIIGATPTGAWAGFAHRVAQWIGVWSLSSMPIGHHAVDNSKGINAASRWLERTASGWASGVSRLVQRQPGNFAPATNMAGVITLTLDPAPASAADLTGVPVRFLSPLSSTGATSLNGGTGLVDLRWPDLSALAAGDIANGELVEVMFDGTRWIRLGGLSPARVRDIIKASRSADRIVRAFTSSATWTKPAGLLFAEIAGLAGGAGGGMSVSSSSAVFSGGGGGNGGMAKDAFRAADLPASVSITIGGGGLGRSGVTAGAGANGGTTSFGSLLSATGGVAGTGASDAHGVGGNGGDGTSTGRSSLQRFAGTRGSDGFLLAGGTFPTEFGGYGRGGQGGFHLTPSATGVSGGAGQPGIVIVTEYYG